MTDPSIVAVNRSIPLPAFGDAEQPYDIPTTHAALYSADCDHPAPAGSEKLFEQVRWITFAGNRGCSIADFEVHTEVYQDPELLARWFRIREIMDRRAIIYCDRADANLAYVTVSKSPRALFWIATLDDKPLSAQSLADELARDWHAPIPASQLWAQQIVDHGNWDESHLYRMPFQG